MREEKETEELKKILKSARLGDYDAYCDENDDSMGVGETAFGVYVKEILHERGLTQQNVFLEADIAERYGYKLLSGEKRTRRRDVILRICYAARMTLDETQRALKKYEMPELYAKNPRGALLMIIFNERPGGIIEVNKLLIKNKQAPLHTSGAQD